MHSLNKDKDCITREGAGPIGSICKDCIFARGFQYNGKDIYVCDLDHSDLNPMYRACGKFQNKEVHSDLNKNSLALNTLELMLELIEAKRKLKLANIA